MIMKFDFRFLLVFASKKFVTYLHPIIAWPSTDFVKREFPSY
jgi:hypothetical protein